MFVHSNESQNKHAFNPVIIILTENIRRSAYDARHKLFSCHLIVHSFNLYFTFCFLLDWSPQRWSRPDDSFSVFPELIHWSGFFHFSFPPLGLLPRCEEFFWYFLLFSPFWKNTIPVTRMTLITRLCNSKKGFIWKQNRISYANVSDTRC